MAEPLLEDFRKDYFFLYPAGHFGLTAVTFLEVFPLRQIIVDFFTGDFCGAAVGVGVGVGVTFTSDASDPERTTRIVGLE